MVVRIAIQPITIFQFPITSYHSTKMLEFEKKVAGFIKVNALLGSEDKVLLAVSGGADSIALLYTMRELTNQNVLSIELLCTHINHQLREAEANLDEDFVLAQAAKLKLPVTTKRLDVRGFARRNRLSIETAARQLRIESLLDIAKANNCSRIATGHQKNDNAETVLQRLARGTGFRGIGGIWPMRSLDGKIKFIRPLLCVTRDEILDYLKERGLKWQVDHTNADCTYRRNYIRHRLLPALQHDCTGSIVEQLSQLAAAAHKFYGLVCNRADKAWPELTDCAGDKVVLNTKGIMAEHPAVKIELVRRSLATIGSGERALTGKHYEKILQLAKQSVSGKKIKLPGRFIVRREYGNLIFARCAQDSIRSEQIAKSIELEIPGIPACAGTSLPLRKQGQFGQYLIEATIFEAKEQKFLAPSFTGGFVSQFIEKFDFDKLEPPIVIRPRHVGDRFWPLGLSAEKKVGKFLTAAKVPQEVRVKALIVADKEKIIWVWPVRISEQVKITGETRKILQIQITDAAGAKEHKST